MPISVEDQECEKWVTCGAQPRLRTLSCSSSATSVLRKDLSNGSVTVRQTSTPGSTLSFVMPRNVHLRGCREAILSASSSWVPILWCCITSFLPPCLCLAYWFMTAISRLSFTCLCMISIDHPTLKSNADTWLKSWCCQIQFPEQESYVNTSAPLSVQVIISAASRE